MKKILFQLAMQTIITVMTPDLLKLFADKMLDWLEDHVIGTKSQVDDNLVLPAIAQIRAAFGIEDSD